VFSQHIHGTFYIIKLNFCRDAPEATGDEPEDTDFDMPKIYEPVS